LQYLSGLVADIKKPSALNSFFFGANIYFLCIAKSYFQSEKVRYFAFSFYKNSLKANNRRIYDWGWLIGKLFWHWNTLSNASCELKFSHFEQRLLSLVGEFAEPCRNKPKSKRINKYE
jgi:hypothetical protein